MRVRSAGSTRRPNPCRDPRWTSSNGGSLRGACMPTQCVDELDVAGVAAFRAPLLERRRDGVRHAAIGLTGVELADIDGDVRCRQSRGDPRARGGRDGSRRDRRGARRAGRRRRSRVRIAARAHVASAYGDRTGDVDFVARCFQWHLHHGTSDRAVATAVAAVLPGRSQQVSRSPDRARAALRARIGVVARAASRSVRSGRRATFGEPHRAALWRGVTCELALGRAPR